MNFGAFIIGDEILVGKRQDKHFSFIIDALGRRGLRLSWAQYLGDEREVITTALERSFASGDAVFSFGGIGATPDDHTRQCAAAALGVPLELHPEAEREIRGRFYVDGATVDNLPVGTGRILGTDLILAIDVSASNAFRADTQEDGFAAVFARATEIAMQSLLELRMREWTTPPIYYIHPRVEHISAFDFDHLREIVEEGYRATVAGLDRPAEWPAPRDAGVYPRRAVTIRVQRERCIGCGACLVQAPPGMFVLDAQGKAVVTRPEQEWSPIDGEFIRHCPTYAISARPAAAPKAADAAG